MLQTYIKKLHRLQNHPIILFNGEAQGKIKSEIRKIPEDKGAETAGSGQ